MIPAVVYLLCTAASAACAVLLSRGYSRTRTRLLLWSSICFAFLALNNLALVVEQLIYPAADLRTLRSTMALIGMSVLIYGLVWHSRRS